MDRRPDQVGKLVRERLSRFLMDRSARTHGVRRILHECQRRWKPAAIFGGAIRDVASGVQGRAPRDVDIVVDNTTTEELRAIFGTYVIGETRFGGLRLQSEGWSVDMWPLDSTWAFRSGLVAPASLENITNTVFLNIEAVALEWTSLVFGRRHFFHNGFFECLRTKTLDVVLAENPNPELCVVRTFVIARRMGFLLSPSLGSVLARIISDSSTERLMQMQMEHYGVSRLGREEMVEMCNCVMRQQDKNDVIRFPTTVEPQMRFEFAQGSGERPSGVRVGF